MIKKEELSREILVQLAYWLKPYMTSLSQIIVGFPESNMEIKYPALSIYTPGPKFTPAQVPYLYNQGQTQDSTGKTNNLYVWGSYDWTIQLDLWASTKEQRYKMIGEFEKAISGQFPVIGATVQLENYYDLLCRYDFEGYNYDNDSEMASQTKEWRVKIDLMAHCNVISEQKENVVETIELDDNDINETIIIEV